MNLWLTTSKISSWAMKPSFCLESRNWTSVVQRWTDQIDLIATLRSVDSLCCSSLVDRWEWVNCGIARLVSCTPVTSEKSGETALCNGHPPWGARLETVAKANLFRVKWRHLHLLWSRRHAVCNSVRERLYCLQEIRVNLLGWYPPRWCYFCFFNLIFSYSCLSSSSASLRHAK